ncbi:F-box domain protein [Lasiodiplodia theobromae]|uniref:F-box domain protein n=1 Tax=Lasiodiplodia theobromae TaxID=45133 RepID=UPI0015C35419|nr:F-box domain protein [Lasiodiplodia theobromae]KAF4539184.1 F-box domain protein [Lasiodiplodia theobromae]
MTFSHGRNSVKSSFQPQELAESNPDTHTTRQYLGAELPTELTCAIATFLGTNDVLSLRLACRNLNTQLHDTFINLCPVTAATTVTNLTRPCLGAFLAACQHPGYAHKVEKLGIISEWPTPLGADIAANSSSEAQRRLTATDDDVALLRAVLVLLQNMNTVAIVPAELSPVAPLRILPGSLQASDRSGTNPVYGDDCPQRTVNTVMRALAAVEGRMSLDRFEMRMRPGAGLVPGAEIFSASSSGGRRGSDNAGGPVGTVKMEEVGHEEEKKDPMQNENDFWRGLAASFANLNTLSLVLKSGDPAIMPPLRRFFALFPHLRSLRLDLQAQYGWSDGWKYDINPAFSTTRFTSLERLELYCFNIPSAWELLHFIEPCANTLQLLSFCGATLHRGEDWQSADWVVFFQGFLDLLIREKMPLKEMFLRDLYQDTHYDGGPEPALVRFVEQEEKWGWNRKERFEDAAWLEEHHPGNDEDADEDVVYLRGNDTILEALPDLIEAIVLDPE